MGVVCCALGFLGGIIVVYICKMVYEWCERREW